MASFQKTIAGAHVRLYINGELYNEVQALDWTIDYGEEPIYGIDSIFPQEIKTSRISTSGSIQGIRVKNTGGAHGANLRPQIFSSQNSPYISIRVQDKQTAEDLLFLPSAKITSERCSLTAKGTMKVSFSFIAVQPLQPMDRV
jgi:hypothetical protein